LNRSWFRTMDEARVEIDSWRQHYNYVRPHSSLNYLSPVEYARVLPRYCGHS
ncbi:integrase core domain-containing protein, partial [Pseudomonas sp. 5Ae-yellow]|uniref:integrase core domain-containing protein n=1 Tax=Pseudomonas sp. 5Ae-yellow TaxID=2759848 RepID=UPI0015F5AC33